MVYPQILPVLSKPRFVLSPDNVKYYKTERRLGLMELSVQQFVRTRGRKMIETMSSSFSVIVMLRPPSRG